MCHLIALFSIFISASVVAGGDGPTSADLPDVGITEEADRQLLPGAPGLVERQGNRIRWLGTRLDIVRHYLVYRVCAEERTLLGRVEAVGDNSGWYELSAPAPNHCTYEVSTVDIYGNEGPAERAARLHP